MISAKEARKQFDQNKQNILNKEIITIEKEMNNEISKGNNNVYIDGSISLNARQMLEQLGYDVKCGSQYNESYVNIEWQRR